MGELFEITYERFLDEIRQAKLMPGGFNKIEMEDFGDTYGFYLTLVGIDKTYVTVIDKRDFQGVPKMNLVPYARPARRVTNDTEFENIIKLLAKVEEELKKVPQAEMLKVV